MLKKCRICGKEKPLEEFHKHSGTKDRLRNECKKCNVVLGRTWYRKNNEVARKAGREWYKRNIDKVKLKSRKSMLKTKYGLTLDEYDKILESQGMCCAICGTPKPGGMGRFHVDHCHKTGKIRGLLCNHCNTGIGKLHDDPELLRTAADYLDR